VWHGPALRQLVQSVTAEQASARPVPGAHSIWEYVLHVTTYEDVVRRRLGGEPVGELPREQGWPAVADTSHDAWAATRQHFEQCHNRLREALWGFPDERLNDTVPGRDYPFYLMLYGIIQHDLYHAGQIVLLMEAQGLKPLG
jgi:uncharacterized damage-inducible protein DinB